MTKKEFYEAIANGANNEETVAYAIDRLEKMNAANAKRAIAQRAKADEFNRMVVEIIGHLDYEGDFILASDAAVQFGTSTQKASSILRRAVELGKATSQDVKVAGKGYVKGYTILDE